MNEERFADLFQVENVSSRNLKPGDRIDARVADISGENIFLDVGGKSEGVMAAAEVRNPDGRIELKPGDSVKVYLLAVRGGEMVFTTRVGSSHASLLELEEAFRSGIPVEGRVVSEIKGGFEVVVAGQRGFCPYSQMDIRRVEDPADYLDKACQFKIIEFTGNGRNIILSARVLLEEERERQRETLRETLEEGARISGTVTSIRDFGAFVDIGGIDGLIPISELAWGQVDRVEDILSRDQQVEVVIRKLDWDNDRISLSLRETTESPWDSAVSKYPEGSIHQGRVSRLAAFGAFITLEPGLDGLLHISKLGAGRRINHPREVLEIGGEITVRIDSVEADKKRISLAPEDAAPDREEDERPARDPAVKSTPKTLGTLGDLLRDKLAGKK
ncbi:30S ribosomal protein S1 [bacterium BMS3Bbin14]|nr:30S ribosomal protein S1 [bacterium BMS3Abin13]GBE52765.1 30S ribosomal protein S1 [bacterium BMS3Bbin14]HDO29803.1 30S ribosomal protein S1 [Desulfobacteraceae bacterium]